MTQNQFLWNNFLRGNKSALSEIFLTFHDDLYRFGLKLSGDQNMVQDCIQDLFLKLWKNKENLKQVESIKPYLFKSLRNHIIDSISLRKTNIYINAGFEHPFEITYSHEDFLISQQVSEETRLKVVEALNKLTIRQRETIYLRYFEDFDFETIAIVMDMNVQSVRNLLYRGMKVLRDLLIADAFFLMLAKSIN
jgi:RNA polymerase sigma factor (sigma-70 family)